MRAAVLPAHFAEASADNPLVADPGEDGTMLAGDTVALDGTGSTDADGHGPTYQWSITTRSPNSGTALADPIGAQRRFVADRPGLSVVQLIALRD